MKRRIFATLISVVLLLQVFCLTALADGEITYNVGLDMTNYVVYFDVEGLEPNSEVSLVGFVNGGDISEDVIDYINQYTADEDGVISDCFPSNIEWVLGDIITVKINGVNTDVAIQFATAEDTKFDKPVLITVKANTSGEIKSVCESAPYAAPQWSSSNESVLLLDASRNTATYYALKSGTAVVKVTYATEDGGTFEQFITVRVNP